MIIGEALRRGPQNNCGAIKRGGNSIVRLFGRTLWLFVFAVPTEGAMAARLHYVDFTLMPYYALTIENFEQSTPCSVTLGKSEIAKIHEALQRRKVGESRFRSTEVRMLLTEDDGARTFIDRQGGVFTEGKEYQLSPADFVLLYAVATQIVESRKSKDCRRR